MKFHREAPGKDHDRLNWVNLIKGSNSARTPKTELTLKIKALARRLFKGLTLSKGFNSAPES